MDSKKEATEEEPENAAIGTGYRALEKLAPDAQARVLAYVQGRFKINAITPEKIDVGHSREPENASETVAVEDSPDGPKAEDGGLEGISPVAKKWMI
jgi:hypothetical protein